ncbi:unnamed protein product, partial [marine sediment metagenome]
PESSLVGGFWGVDIGQDPPESAVLALFSQTAGKKVDNGQVS